MSTASTRRTALKKFMSARGLRQSSWAKSAGVPESTLRSFLNGDSNSLRHDTLEKLAQAAEATISEITGETPPKIPPGNGIVHIRSLQIRAAMGGGFEVFDEPEGPPFPLKQDWVDAAVGQEHGQLRILANLSGDSMRPTLNDGDVALVIIPGRFISGAIYVLWDGIGLVVKRLESIVGAERPRLRIISDNAEVHKPYDVNADDVRIIGKLIWRAGRP